MLIPVLRDFALLRTSVLGGAFFILDVKISSDIEHSFMSQVDFDDLCQHVSLYVI